MPHEARQEQDGTVLRPLPVATDPRFIIGDAPAEEESAGEESAGESSDTPGNESESNPETEKI